MGQLEWIAVIEKAGVNGKMKFLHPQKTTKWWKNQELLV